MEFPFLGPKDCGSLLREALFFLVSWDLDSRLSWGWGVEDQATLGWDFGVVSECIESDEWSWGGSDLRVFCEELLNTF